MAEPLTPAPRLVEWAPPELDDALGTLWTSVTRANGAVGFLPDEPEDDIRAAAVAAMAEVRAGRHRMIVIDDPVSEGRAALVGVVVLVPGEAPRKGHLGTVLRLMVHPDRQGEGWGRALLDASVSLARELGLEQLLLSARGGTTLPAFYRRQGWKEVGVFPGVLHLGDERRDEHWFQLTV